MGRLRLVCFGELNIDKFVEEWVTVWVVGILTNLEEICFSLGKVDQANNCCRTAILASLSQNDPRHNMSNEKKLGWLFDLRDYTTQLYGDYTI